MTRANDPTLDAHRANVFAHLTFKQANNPWWDRILDRELHVRVGDIVGVAMTQDSEEQISDHAEEHYIVTDVERVMRLHPTGDTLVQFITLEECAPPMSADDAPIDQPATKD